MKLLFTWCVAISQIIGYTLKCKLLLSRYWQFFSIQEAVDNFGSLPRALFFQNPIYQWNDFNRSMQLPPSSWSLYYPTLFSSKEATNERQLLTLRKLNQSKTQIYRNMFASYLIASQRSTICIKLNYYSDFQSPYPRFLFSTPPSSDFFIF